LFQDLLASLRSCLLEFTQRLHRAEVDRHSLHRQLAQLLSHRNAAVDIIEDEDHCKTNQVQESLFLRFNLVTVLTSLLPDQFLKVSFSGNMLV